MPILLHSLYSLILSFTPLLLCGKEKRMGTNQNLPLPLVAFFIRPVISSLINMIDSKSILKEFVLLSIHAVEVW